ncbi:RagB/SusD family nutrient uptake outer membrane protein [Bacteroides ovatus]|nr:RagB/SusD family nutrient uptake outer membrane protein [Bacteroides ovatus]
MLNVNHVSMRPMLIMASNWHRGNKLEVQNQDQQSIIMEFEMDMHSMYWLRTGVGVAKYVHPDDTYYNSDAAKVKDKDEPAIRYDDILLMYAEALNELTASYEVPSGMSRSLALSSAT